MAEFHGKQRIFKTYLAISASGPEPASVRSGLFGTRRSRDGADLLFTTADCDWFLEHLREPNYDTGVAEHFNRLANPTLEQVLSAIHEAGQCLSEHVGDPRWDGGQFTIIYAGHGSHGSGAWVFGQEHLHALHFAETLLASVEATSRHLRLDLILDSCFAGAFFAELLEYAWKQDDHRLFVCDAFGAALPEELAWELDDRGHGAFTFAFKAMLEPLVTGYPSLPRQKPTGIRDTDRLRSGGVSWLTDDEQHAFEYTNGHLEIIGGGAIKVYDAPRVRSHALQSAMMRAVNVMPHGEVTLK